MILPIEVSNLLAQASSITLVKDNAASIRTLPPGLMKRRSSILPVEVSKLLSRASSITVIDDNAGALRSSSDHLAPSHRARRRGAFVAPRSSRPCRWDTPHKSAAGAAVPPRPPPVPSQSQRRKDINSPLSPQNSADFSPRRPRRTSSQQLVGIQRHRDESNLDLRACSAH